MDQSQNVTDYPNNNTIFMVWNFKNQVDIKPTFEKLCSLVSNLNNSYTIRIPNGRSSCVMGVGHDAWIRLGLPTPLPKELVNYESIIGGKHTAKATSGDLHFHLRAQNVAICFDMAMAITNVLESVAECQEEVHGFRYWDGRSIIGFVDGTENPIGDERQFFAVVGDEDSAYKGGSYLFVQKYFHNMKNWENLSTEDQEKVIGRSKMNDIEMADDVKPANSHSALTAITDDEGNELKIVRDNMPFGNPSKGEVGTYFISYASKFSTTRKMLENMFIGNPPGNYDRILDFSTAETGTLFFVPTLDLLDQYSGDSDS
jgi:putative iron-dependent peroxidase